MIAGRDPSESAPSIRVQDMICYSNGLLLLDRHTCPRLLHLLLAIPLDWRPHPDLHLDPLRHLPARLELVPQRRQETLLDLLGGAIVLALPIQRPLLPANRIVQLQLGHPDIEHVLIDRVFGDEFNDFYLAFLSLISAWSRQDSRFDRHDRRLDGHCGD